MKTFAPLVVLTLLMAADILAERAHAQFPPPYRQPNRDLNRPALSPYLNLLRGGSPAANYYMGVRPERERRAADAALYQLEQDVFGRPPTSMPMDLEEPVLPATGHSTYFMNYSHYYGGNSAMTPAAAYPRAPRGRPR